MKKMSEYVETLILEDYPELHFICFNRVGDQAIAVTPKSGKVHFFYKVNDDLSFHFNLLCEVGERYQQWFKSALAHLGYNLMPQETKTDYYEIIIEKVK